MTIKQMIAVMQAHEEGKTIEYRRLQDTGPLGKWSEHPDPHWAWDTHEYRVKTEPIEIEVWVAPDGSLGRIVQAEDVDPVTPGWTKKKFREVL